MVTLRRPAKKPYDPSGCHAFGRALVTTEDLDPVYVVLWNSHLERDILECYLLAYWCFYHVGTAAWICDPLVNSVGGKYWQRMEQAAGSKEYPRSSERRHFRGGQALEAVAWLKARGVEKLFAPLYTMTSAVELMGYVKTWKRFGPWISFKVADMLERLDLAPVKFTLHDALYESPQAGADLLWEMEEYPEIPPMVSGTGAWAMERIQRELKGLLAPPRYERPLGPQECETVLCKWKSSLGGHYRLGEDIEAVHKGLEKFADCTLSKLLLQAGSGRLW